MFPLQRQINYHVQEYQEWTHQEVISFDYTAGRYKSVDYQVNQIERNVRYLMFFIQSYDQLNDQTMNLLDKHLLDCVSSIWVEINQEKLLTKIETPIKWLQVQNREFMFGKEGKAFNGQFPGYIAYLPFAIDCDFHAPGSGHIDMKPAFNSTKLRVIFDNKKIQDLYFGEDPVYMRNDNDTNTAAKNTGASFSPSHKHTGNGSESYNGSGYGMIQKDSSSTADQTNWRTTKGKYKVNAKITVRALCLDMITFDYGQFFKHC
jgi:hypothetical protein